MLTLPGVSTLRRARVDAVKTGGFRLSYHAPLPTHAEMPGQNDPKSRIAKIRSTVLVQYLCHFFPILGLPCYYSPLPARSMHFIQGKGKCDGHPVPYADALIQTGYESIAMVLFCRTL